MDNIDIRKLNQELIRLEELIAEEGSESLILFIEKLDIEYFNKLRDIEKNIISD